MKTLDEVIKGFECCENTDCGNCPYKILFNDDSHVPCDQFSKDEDALHYLKVFQKHEERVRGQLDDLKEEYRPNDPLTWSQLKQMEGKPVWVEADYFEKGWFLVDASLVDIWVTGYDCAEHQLRKEDIGVSWQAYRKERNVD